MGALETALHLELARGHVDEDVHRRVRAHIDERQREQYLRQQMKAIRDALGEEGGEAEADELTERLAEMGLPDEAYEACSREIKRLRSVAPSSAEYQVIRTYVGWVLELPWTEKTEDRLDLEAAQAALDADHTGLDKVKERILEHLAVRKLNPERPGAILCLVGPPGVGKTSLGRGIAEALGRKFARMSVGGLRDESEIKGHRRTYVGAMPGKILQLLKKCGTRNPVLQIDEIDKMGSDHRGDPSSALLEVLDPSCRTASLPGPLSRPATSTSPTSSSSSPRTCSTRSARAARPHGDRPISRATRARRSSRSRSATCCRGSSLDNGLEGDQRVVHADAA